MSVERGSMIWQWLSDWVSDCSGLNLYSINCWQGDLGQTIFGLPVPPFPFLANQNNKNTYFGVVLRLNKVIHVKVIHVKHSVQCAHECQLLYCSIQLESVRKLHNLINSLGGTIQSTPVLKSFTVLHLFQFQKGSGSAIWFLFQSFHRFFQPYFSLVNLVIYVCN